MSTLRCLRLLDMGLAPESAQLSIAAAARPRLLHERAHDFVFTDRFQKQACGRAEEAVLSLLSDPAPTTPRRFPGLLEASDACHFRSVQFHVSRGLSARAFCSPLCSMMHNADTDGICCVFALCTRRTAVLRRSSLDHKLRAYRTPKVLPTEEARSSWGYTQRSMPTISHYLHLLNPTLSSPKERLFRWTLERGCSNSPNPSLSRAA